MRQSLVEKIHTLAVHWGFFYFFINDFAKLAHCPWLDFVDDKNLFGLAPDLKACEIYKLWISECFCRVIAIKLATFVDSKIIKFKCLNLQWFPNLFRSFSNHRHHFPEETNRIPLKVQLISHLITVSVLLYAGTDTCKTRYVYKQSFFKLRSSNPAKQMFSNQAIGLWHQKGVNTTYQRNKTLFTVKRIIRRNPNGNFICWLYTRS